MDLLRQRRRLVAMLRELEAPGPAAKDSGRQLRDYAHDLSVFDNHPADVASEDYQKRLDEVFRQTDLAIVEKIQAAISRIDKGTYQTCQGCGGPIDLERLEALPYADTCVACGTRELGGYTKPASFPRADQRTSWPRFRQYGSTTEEPR